MAWLRTALAAIGLIVGIAVGGWAGAGVLAAVIAGCLSVALFTAAALTHRGNNLDPLPGELLPALTPLVACMLMSGLVLAGFSTLTFRTAALDRAYLPKLASEKVELTGRMASDPQPGRRSWRFTMKVRRAGTAAVNEKIAVTTYGKMPKAQLGDLVKVRLKLKALDPRDPFDRSLSRRSVVARGTGSAGELRVLAKTSNPALAAANHFRNRITEAASSTLGSARAGLLLGLVIGDEAAIPEGVKADFRAAGLSHLTAVSGANVAMVIVPLMLILTALGTSRRIRVAVGLAVLAMFTIVTRWEPSVLRAVIMASAALGAWVFGRRSNAPHLLALAVIVMLAFDPLMLWSIGFQLSFVATAGILLLAPVLEARLTKFFSYGAGAGDGAEAGNGNGAGAGRWKRAMIQATAIGLAAQIAVLPLIAWHFGRISLVALPANLAAFGLVGPPTVLGLVAGVVSVFSIPAAKPLMWLAGWFVWALQAIARIFGGSAHSQVDVPNWRSPQMLAAYLLLAAAVLWLAERPRLARWPGVLALMTIVVAGLTPVAGSAHPSGMRLTFFNVGQGDAALVESPGGARVLIDGGPDPHYISGRLSALGIRRIDLVIASHAHTDHVAGLSEVMSQMQVRELVDPGVDAPVMRRVLAIAGSEKPAIATDGNQLRIGDLTVDFLGPTPDARTEAEVQRSADPGGEGTGLNDASVVARISFGQSCALFTGDIEEPAQQLLLENHPGEIECAILKAPHHGSASLLPAFVEGVKPSWTPISVGANDYGHPTAKALALFSRSGGQVVRTDLTGDIVLIADRQGRVSLKR
ncbi:MAG: ComEC/Rec2 family competence protein [Actinomycetota bacterium]